MKWIALCLGGLVLAAVAVSSCSINHRSGQYECNTSNDCDDGRTCNGGLCVAIGVDAPPGDGGLKKDAAIDAADACPSQCTSCSAAGKVCTIDCAAGAVCTNAAVTCPAGWSCAVRCNTTNSCRSGVSCTGTLSCDVQCSGANSCRAVTCGPGRCNVSCTGSNSCRGSIMPPGPGVTCGPSCGCDVTCNPANGACANTVVCNKLQCDTGLGCSSTVFPSCSTCP